MRSKTPVFTGPYADIKATVYHQLKEQGMLEHFELQLAALIPQESETASPYRYTNSWNAPNGGVLCYTYDWTYRGEDGYVACCRIYMDQNDTNAYLAGDFGSVGDLISAVADIGVSTLASKIPMFSFLGTLSSIFAAAEVVSLLEDIIARNSINNADGYAKLSVVYDSISGGYSKVLLGWDTHPTVTLDWPDAYNVSFDY